MQKTPFLLVTPQSSLKAVLWGLTSFRQAPINPRFPTLRCYGKNLFISHCSATFQRLHIFQNLVSIIRTGKTVFLYWKYIAFYGNNFRGRPFKFKLGPQCVRPVMQNVPGPASNCFKTEGLPGTNLQCLGRAW